MTDYLLPNEPQRFVKEEFDRLVVFCSKLNASDITVQTNEPVYSEIYGRL
jgi:defect-in-organelle-trafficking protein DotB